MKIPVKLKVQNGINFKSAVETMLWELTDLYEFIESDDPEFIIFGPYGNDLPQKGHYVRIGYFCENIIPDLSICEWAFGIPHEDEVKSSRYKRIQWHGLNPRDLIKDINDNEIDIIFNSKTNFCNFLYSHKVPYREAFFKQLSRYRRIDAPGKSMNNMPTIDRLYSGNIWERKQKFLSSYKFTIAFENYCYPGYQTEKLYDAMKANSIPIYCGDPKICDIFNNRSFLNTVDYVKIKNTPFLTSVEKSLQMDFVDIRPQFFKSPYHRLKRKVKAIGRFTKMFYQFNNLDFSELIDRIAEIDKDPSLYKKYLQQPWFNGNVPPSHLSTKAKWIEIFSKK